MNYAQICPNMANAQVFNDCHIGLKRHDSFDEILQRK